MNRVLVAIEKRRDQLAAGVKADGSPITADLVAFERGMDNTPSDHATFQNLQAQAFAAGKLSIDEAQTIYAALGEVPGPDGWASGTDLAAKVVITQIMRELLDMEVAA